MADFEDFTKQPWRIKNWGIEGNGKIPVDGFGPGRPLKIDEHLASGPLLPRLVDLTWKNGNGEECLLQELPFKDENGTLHSARILVSFAGHPPIPIQITLSIGRDGVLTGKLAMSGMSGCGPWQEGNTGTFAADADPPRPGDHGASGRGRRRRALVPV